MHQIISNTFKLLNDHNIKFCVLRNYKTLGIELPSGDIDVLIPKEDLNNLVMILNQKSTIKPYLTMRHSQISADLFFKVLDNKKVRTVNFEFRTSLCGYNKYGIIYEYLDTNLILNNLKINEYNIPILNNSDYFIHLYHEVFYEGKNKYIEELRSLDLSDSDTKKIKNKFTNQQIPELSSINETLVKKSALSFLFYKYSFSLYRNIIYFFRPKGKLIIFLGPDGSGKTTICDSFVEKHKRSFPKLIRMNLANRPIFLKSIFGSNEKSNEPVLDPTFKHKAYTKSDKKTTIRNYFRVIYHCVDHILHYVFVIRPIMVKGGSVFSERYFYDYLCSDKRYLPGVSLHFKKFLLFFVPKPSLVFVLNVKPELLYIRKPELSIDQIKYEQKNYINHNYHNLGYIIDNNKSINETISIIEKQILK